MAGILYELDAQRLIDRNGVSSGGQIFFYLTGSSVKANIYTDINLTILAANPVVADADGAIPSIYLDPSIMYRRYIVYADGSTNTADPLSVGAYAQAKDARVATVAAAKALTANVGDVIETSGFYSPGDGGGGRYSVQPSGQPNSVGSTSNGLTLVPLPNMGVYNILSAGAKADNATDVTPAFNLLMNLVSQGSGAYISGPRIKFPAASSPYYSASTMSLKKICILEGDGTSAVSGVPATTLRFAANTFGIVINRYDTLTDQVISPTSTAADGSMIKGMQIVGAGTDATKHGIWLRARATIEDVKVSNFPGNNINIVASSGSPSAGTNTDHGNANTWQMNRVTSQGSGLHACYIVGTDANAGTSVGFECLTAGRGGLIDISFLGNTHIGVEIDETNSSNTGYVSYTDGHYYALVSNTAGVGATTTPGTNARVWYDMGAGGQAYPAWSASGTYNMCCGLYNDNPNNRSIYIGPYMEGGTIGRVLTPCILIGQQGSFTNDTPYMFSAGGIGGQIMSYTGVGGFQYLPTGDTRGRYAYTSANYDSLQVGNQNVTWRLASTAYSPTDLTINAGNDGQSGVCLTGNPTNMSFGRSTTVPNAFYMPSGNIAIGPGSGSARIMTNGTGIPTTGVAAAGEVVWNRSPTPGGTLLWICTTAGSNGSGGTAVWTPVTLN